MRNVTRIAVSNELTSDLGVTDHRSGRLAHGPYGGNLGSTPTVNWDELSSKLGNEPGFVQELLGVVLETNRGVPAALREAARTRDLPSIERLAHRVRGTAGDLVARACHDLARQTEEAAHEAAPSAPGHSLQLADALDAVLDEVRGHLTR